MKKVINAKRTPSRNKQPLAVSFARLQLNGISRAVLSKLPKPLLYIIVAILSRAQDPDVEVVDVSHQHVPDTRPLSWGWLPGLTLTGTLGVLSVAYAYNTAREGVTGMDTFFWLGLLVIFVPSAARLISLETSRFERIGLLCTLNICLYFIYILYNPLSFMLHDSFIHWRTADDIARSNHLFSENSLLPTSSFYPGLEIVTNAFSTLTGLNIFYAGAILIAVARLLTVLSLFRIYEYVTRSSRIAGIALLFYMANPHFLLFDVQFSYESLALPLATFMLFILTRYETLKRNYYWMTACAYIVIGAVVVTHHMTSYVFDGFLVLWAIAYRFNGAARFHQLNPGNIALFGMIITLLWANLDKNPVVGYLSSYFGNASDELQHVLVGASKARHLFSVYYGQPAPLWERITSITSIALILLCLPFGLLCLWQRYRDNTFARMLALASLLYPISQVFRFTNFGSEITDRAASFLFIPISCMLAIFIAQFWPVQQLNWRQSSFITCGVSVIFLGGAILGAGPPWELLPGPYLVAADQRSIEPEGIETALWANSYLGPDNRIAADRINRLLMTTYGNQRAVTGLEENVNLAPIFFSSGVGSDAVANLRTANVRYIVVDLRLSRVLPALGFYIDPGEPDSFQHTTPMNLKALTKFDALPQANRVFDSGDIVIYDIGGLTSESKKT